MTSSARIISGPAVRAAPAGSEVQGRAADSATHMIFSVRCSAAAAVWTGPTFSARCSAAAPGADGRVPAASAVPTWNTGWTFRSAMPYSAPKNAYVCQSTISAPHVPARARRRGHPEPPVPAAAAAARSPRAAACSACRWRSPVLPAAGPDRSTPIRVRNAPARDGSM